MTREGPSAVALAQALTVEPADPAALLAPDRPLAFRARVEARRALSGSADLVIRRRNGGRWRFELAVEASEPEVCCRPRFSSCLFTCGEKPKS